MEKSYKKPQYLNGYSYLAEIRLEISVPQEIERDEIGAFAGALTLNINV